MGKDIMGWFSSFLLSGFLQYLDFMVVSEGQREMAWFGLRATMIADHVRLLYECFEGRQMYKKERRAANGFWERLVQNQYNIDIGRMR